MTPTSSTRRKAALLASATVLAGVLACGGSTSGTGMSDATTGSISLVVTDAPSDAWSEVGVVIRKAVLVPAGSTAANGVTIFDGTTAGAALNLVDLDGLSELLSSAQIPAGTYNRLVLQVDGDPADVTLVPSDGSGQIPASDLIVRGADPATKLATLTVDLSTPVVVSSGQPTSVQVDFDLLNPLFIVAHPLGSTTLYMVDLQIRQTIQNAASAALSAINLRIAHGQADQVATDAKSFRIKTIYGAEKTFTIDGAAGAAFYNLDASPVSPVRSTTVPSTLAPALYTGVAARLQSDGTLVATQVWYSATASKILLALPEGHVNKVDTANNAIWVFQQDGSILPFTVDANTQYFFQNGTTAIGSGETFLANLARGFKVQVAVADPAATQKIATSITIQRGNFEGSLLAADASGFTYQRNEVTPPETHSVGYGSGFTWWDFAHPSKRSTDLSAFALQAAPASGPASAGISTLDWSGSGWVAKDAVFVPSRLSNDPQTITKGYDQGSLILSYTPSGGPAPVNLRVNLGTVGNGLTVVTEYSRSGNVLSIVPLLTQAQWSAKLAAGAKVYVFGLPKGDGSLNAYWINLVD